MSTSLQTHFRCPLRIAVAAFFLVLLWKSSTALSAETQFLKNNIQLRLIKIQLWKGFSYNYSLDALDVAWNSTWVTDATTSWSSRGTTANSKLWSRLNFLENLNYKIVIVVNFQISVKSHDLSDIPISQRKKVFHGEICLRPRIASDQGAWSALECYLRRQKTFCLYRSRLRHDANLQTQDWNSRPAWTLYECNSEQKIH